VTRTGEIPCFKLFESEKTLAFLDINPLSRGHAVSHCFPSQSDPSLTRFDLLTAFVQLVIPKFHGEKLTDIPDEALSEILV